MNVLFAWVPGPMELIVLGGIMLLLFGNRLPSVMRSLGQSVVEFKKGVNGIEEDTDKAANSGEKSKSDRKES